MSTLERRSLERTRYRKGQSLRSRDFRDLLRNEAHLRWWHNRAIHSAYGVFDGFQLEQLSTSLLRVHPGKAYDAYGREIMLTRPVVIPIHDPVEGRVLIVRYQEPDTGCGSTDASSCLLGYRPVEEAGVEFMWKPVEETSYRDGVLLTKLSGIGMSAIFEEIPYTARAYARPRIASGATQPGMTGWELWFGPVIDENTSAFGVKAVIDISKAGFISTPSIFAWLGIPDTDSTGEPFSEEEWEKAFISQKINFISHVENVSPSQFTFRLIVYGGNLPKYQLAISNPQSQSYSSGMPLFVNWLGISCGELQPKEQKTRKRNYV